MIKCLNLMSRLQCECVYLHGCSLLELDSLIEGQVRERLLVAHYRYTAGKTGDLNISNLKCLQVNGISEEFDDEEDEVGVIDDVLKFTR